MSDLQNQTPADTYKGLLQVGDYTNGVDGNSEYVQDGEGTNSALSISTTKVGVGTVSPSAELDVNGNVVADEYALDQTGSSSSAVAIHAPTTNELAIRTNSTERIRIDSAGKFGIGTTSPDYLLDLLTTTNPATLGLKGYGSFVDGSVASQIIFLGRDNVNNNRDLAYIKVKEHDNAVGTGSIEFDTRISGTVATRMAIESDGNVLPGTDDTQDLGSTTKRWDDIYATNTTIQSSDRDLKQDIEELSEAETRVAKACKGLLRKYRWKDAVAQKGDEARIHFGIIAQDLEDAFTAEGLDAGRYGMFVKNTWWQADRVIPAVEAVDAVYDEEGKEVSSAIEAQPERTVTDIFSNSEDAPEGAIEVTQRGVRYSELLAFIIAAI